MSKVSAKGGTTRRGAEAEEAAQQEGQCCLGGRDVESFRQNSFVDWLQEKYFVQGVFSPGFS